MISGWFLSIFRLFHVHRLGTMIPQKGVTGSPPPRNRYHQLRARDETRDDHLRSGEITLLMVIIYLGILNTIYAAVLQFDSTGKFLSGAQAGGQGGFCCGRILLRRNINRKFYCFWKSGDYKP